MHFPTGRPHLVTLAASYLALSALAIGCGDDSTAPAGDGGSDSCTDGQTRVADDGCNDCTCEGGVWRCTERGCAPALAWYATCGDPVCGPDGPTGETPCTAEQTEDADCSDEGALCDPGTGCGQNLVCASSDPRTGPGGCPISRARFKRDIAYLTDAERAELARALLDYPLATYRYIEGDPSPQLGFILEDVEPSPGVDSNRDRVNLYGYITMAVATLQQQQRELDALREEVQRLRAESAPMCAP